MLRLQSDNLLTIVAVQNWAELRRRPAFGSFSAVAVGYVLSHVSIGPAPRRLASRLTIPMAGRHSAPAAIFTVSANSVALKMNDTTPWTVTSRRMELAVTATSDTCEVIPMTNEKYMKSQ